MSEEIWVPVAGYEGRYEVSTHARIRSVPRLVRTIKRNGDWGKRRIPGKVLATHTWGAQYPGLVLTDSRGFGRRRMVHQLVAEAFVPNPHGYAQINHIDADTSNGRPENLEWTDQSMNVAHAYAIGNRPKGASHHFAALPRDSRGFCEAARAKKDGGRVGHRGILRGINGADWR